MSTGAVNAIWFRVLPSPAKRAMIAKANVVMRRFVLVATLGGLGLPAAQFADGTISADAIQTGRWFELAPEDHRLGDGLHHLMLHVSEPSGVKRDRFPVTSGVPLKRGMLADVKGVTLLAENNEPIMLQVKSQARWPDGSIKWLMLDFAIDLEASQTRQLTLQIDSNQNPVARRAISRPLRVEREADGVRIDTGPLQLKIAAEGRDVLEIAGEVSGARPIGEAARLVAQVSRRGSSRWSTFEGRVDRLDVEDAGPLRATIAVHGVHVGPEGDERLPFILRVHAYHGQSALRLEHTFINSEPPAEVALKGIGLRLPLAEAGEWRVMHEGDGERQSITSGEFNLAQEDWNRYQVRVGKAGELGGIHEGVARWLSLSNERLGLTVHHRNADRMFPKAFALDAGENMLTAFFWPTDSERELDLRSILVNPPESFLRWQAENSDRHIGSEHAGRKGEEAAQWLHEQGRDGIGVAMTHELWLDLHAPDRPFDDAADRCAAFNDKLLAFITPQWNARTEAFGPMHPVDTRNFPRIEARYRHTLEFFDRTMNEWERWWGALYYGNFLTMKEPGSEEWWRYVDRYAWLNHESYADHHVFVHYLRSGERRWFDLAEAMANNYLNVVVCNWHDAQPDLVGGGHRHWLDPWSGGVGSGHTFAGGAADLYLLTDNRRGLDVVRLIADYSIRQGLALLKQGITHRGVSNALHNLARAYEITGEQRYYAGAEQIVAGFRDLLVQPDGTVAEPKQFHYFGPALVRWHQVSGSETVRELILGITYTESTLLDGNSNAAELPAYQYFLSGDPHYLMHAAQEAVEAGEAPRQVTPELRRHMRLVFYGGFPAVQAALYGARGQVPVLPQREPSSAAASFGWKTSAPDEAHPPVALRPLDLRGTANANPLASPFDAGPRTALASRPRPLKPDEIGLQFAGPENITFPGYQPVGIFQAWPLHTDDYMPGNNLFGLPWGAALDVSGIRFELLHPDVNHGRGFILLDDVNDFVEIPIHANVRAIHLLGHVYENGAHVSDRHIDNFQPFEVARYRLRFEDGSEQIVPLINARHFDNIHTVPYASEVSVGRVGNADWQKEYRAWRVNKFRLPVDETRRLETLTFKRTTNRVRPILVAATAELADSEEPVQPALRITFGANGQPPVEFASWSEAGAISKTADGARIETSATLALAGDPGRYELEIELAAATNVGGVLDLVIDNQRRVDRWELVAPGGSERLFLPVEIGTAPLPVTFKVWSGSGAVEVRRITLHSRTESFGLPRRRLKGTVTGFTSINRPGTEARFSFPAPSTFGLRGGQLRQGAVSPFRVQLPNGRYRAELCVRDYHHPTILTVLAQGQPIVEDKLFGNHILEFEVDVEDGVLELEFLPSDRRVSRNPTWDLVSLILRAVPDSEPSR